MASLRTEILSQVLFFALTVELVTQVEYSIPVKLGGRERGGPGGPLPWRYRGDTIDSR